MSAGASCKAWSAPRRSISASTGAMSISSSMSARPRARPADAAHRPRQSPHRRASQGLLVPANRFEVLECRAAIDAVAEAAQDTPPRIGALDVLASTCSAWPAAAVSPDDLYDEVRSAAPYAGLTRSISTAWSISSRPAAMRCAPMSASPSIKQDKAGRWRVANPKVRPAIPHECRHHRRGTMLKVRLVAAAAASRRVSLARDRARRPGARRDRGVFHRDAHARRHLRVRRRGRALRGHGRQRGLCRARPARQGPEGPVLYGRQVPALDLSRRARARHAGR
jgi:hypothetical protein